MVSLKQLVSLVLLVTSVSCNLTKVSLPVINHGISKTDSDQWISDLTARRDVIKKWAVVCSGSGLISERRSECYEWDTGEFGSMGCLAAKLAGDNVTADLRCNEVKNSQDLVTGRWFRGKQTWDAEKAACAAGGECPTKDAFSRDEVNGLFSYWTATRDSDAAQKWFNWFESHVSELDNTVQIEKTCDNHSDDRCQLVASSWGLFYKVWKNMGLTPTAKMTKVNLSEYFDMETYRSSIDFDRELAATGVILERVWNIWDPDPGVTSGEKYIVDSEAARLTDYDPNNAMLYFVGKGVDHHLIYDLIFPYCTEKDPGKLTLNQGSIDFIWQRASNSVIAPTTDLVYNHPNGHDCIFLINMVLAALNPRTDDPKLVYHW